VLRRQSSHDPNDIVSRLSSNSLSALLMHSRVNQCSSTIPIETLGFPTGRPSLVGCDREVIWLVDAHPLTAGGLSEVVSSATAISDHSDPPDHDTFQSSAISLECSLPRPHSPMHNEHSRITSHLNWIFAGTWHAIFEKYIKKYNSQRLINLTLHPLWT
jgi:hypothetical protein